MAARLDPEEVESRVIHELIDFGGRDGPPGLSPGRGRDGGGHVQDAVSVGYCMGE